MIIYGFNISPGLLVAIGVICVFVLVWLISEWNDLIEEMKMRETNYKSIFFFYIVVAIARILLWIIVIVIWYYLFY